MHMTYPPKDFNAVSDSESRSWFIRQRSATATVPWNGRRLDEVATFLALDHQCMSVSHPSTVYIVARVGNVATVRIVPH